MAGSVTRSIRAQPELLAEAEAEARRRGLKFNAWVCMVITDALGSEAPSARRDPVKPAAPSAAAEVAKVADVVKAAEVREAQGAGPVYGYQRPAPGARLKGANRQPRR